MQSADGIEFLVHTYADRIMRIGYTWFGNVHDAQDVCQTVLLRLMTHDCPGDSPEAERAWVLRVTINVCKDIKRSAWFRRTVGLDEGAALTVELPEPGDDTVLHAVQSLPLKYRKVIYLHYYEGYAVGEIAKLLGLPPNLVSTHLTRAKRKLRKQLGGEPNEQTISG